MSKILITGGGTGGHYYPLLAVAETIREIGGELVDIYYMGDIKTSSAPYRRDIYSSLQQPKPETPQEEFAAQLRKLGVKIVPITGAKIRRYFDFLNIIDGVKFIYSILEAVIKIYKIMPEVIFSKGGGGSLAVILASRMFFIPLIIHESDSVPSLTARIGAKFATAIAVSFESTVKYFKAAKTIVTGNPMRKEFIQESGLTSASAKNTLGFDPQTPLILVLGGSQGSQRINEFIINNLGQFLPKFQIYHQTGAKNEKKAKINSNYFLAKLEPSLKNRYQITGHLTAADLKTALIASDIVLSRAGAGAISEISAAGKPSVLVPLPESANNHQRNNAYEYSAVGASIVIEENNLFPNIFIAQVEKLLADPQKLKTMGEAAKRFSKPDAAYQLAKIIINTAAKV